MAIAQQYPLGTPKSSDLVIGTSIPDPNTNDDPKTVNFPVSGISALVAAEIPQGATGSGTIGTLPIWIGSTELGDSFLQKGTSGTSIQTSNANTASGASSIAFHQNSSATNTSSTAIGFAAIASNQHSVAIGIGASATGSQSMVFGNGTASGNNSKVIGGFASSATGAYSVSSGFYTEAHDYCETVVGIFNKISTGSQTSRPFSPQNNIFVVGNGTSTANRSNALELSDQGELTLPFYGDNTGLNRRGLTFEAVTGKIISADSPYYTNGEVISASSGGSTTLDADTPGIVFLGWSGANGSFTVNLPNISSPSVNFNPFYHRKFKFVLNGFWSAGKDVVLTPSSNTEEINGAASYTIPSGGYNVVEIWNRGGEWVIISKLIN